MKKITIKPQLAQVTKMTKEEAQRYHDVVKKSHHVYKDKKKFDKKASRRTDKVDFFYGKCCKKQALHYVKLVKNHKFDIQSIYFEVQMIIMKCIVQRRISNVRSN